MTDTTCSPANTAYLLAPELAAVVDVIPQIDLASVDIAAFRAALAQMPRPELPAELKRVQVAERFVPGVNGAPAVRVLCYTPPPEANPVTVSLRPAVLQIHGGGYVIGSPEINDGTNRAMALALGCVVVSPDYRLAPEACWPGPVEDCYAALNWMHEQALALGIDTQRLAVAGDSAGGGLAASLAIYARDRSGPALCFMQLNAPMLDDRSGSTSEPHPYCGEFVWTAATNRFGWRSFLGMEAGGTSVPEQAVPARVQDLRGLPPTYIQVGALDLFLEEDLEFGRRLSRAGVPLELHVIPGACHGFEIARDSPQVRQTTQMQYAALARAFQVSVS